ncbi:hypothetical protein [Thalassobius sp. I31.1]|uniref:hypothetical protein n=1 Tax=Thalassobius sp. I31.1 TaxID=2109912 RepID=UPI0013006799|nr:hypothetical protein [Thalassobius sp. I31.1]
MKLKMQIAGFLAFILALTACGKVDPTTEPPVDMAAFQLGHNVVVADNATPGPLTRSISTEEIDVALTQAIDERFGHYQGDRLLHIGIAVDGYVLALPGIPTILSPKSVLAITVNVWDNETQQKLNAEPRRFSVFERTSAETIIGSGLTQSKSVQLQNLSRNAALKIQNWILEHPDWITRGSAADLAHETSAER